MLKLTGGASGNDLMGWVALPIESAGEQHVQLHAPPLPLSSAEARNPRSDGVGAWVHCTIGRGVTGSHAKFAKANPSVVVQRSAAAAAASGLVDLVSNVGSTLMRQPTKLFRASFSPFLSPRGQSSSLAAAHLDALSALPYAPSSLEAALEMTPPYSTPTEDGAKRNFLVGTLTSASEAAMHGEPELALRGYCTAFTITRGPSMLLVAANMLYKMGQLARADEILKYLEEGGGEGLTADQRSMVLAKREQVQAAIADAQEEEKAPSTPAAAADKPRPMRINKRASIRHQVMDRQMLAELTGDPGTPARKRASTLQEAGKAAIYGNRLKEEVAEELEGSDSDEEGTPRLVTNVSSLGELPNTVTVRQTYPPAGGTPHPMSGLDVSDTTGEVITGRRRQGTDVGQTYTGSL